MIDKKNFKIIINNLIPFKGYSAMNLFGLIFVRRDYFENPRLTQKRFDITMRHESIHSKQIVETGIIFFYIWYILEYIVRLFCTGNHSEAYRGIAFEQEAYANENNVNYKRSFWNFLKYYRKSNKNG
jgi:hypothetical protein